MKTFTLYLFGISVLCLAVGFCLQTQKMKKQVETIDVLTARIDALDAQACDTEGFKVACVQYYNVLAARVNQIIERINKDEEVENTLNRTTISADPVDVIEELFDLPPERGLDPTDVVPVD